MFAGADAGAAAVLQTTCCVDLVFQGAVILPVWSFYVLESCAVEEYSTCMSWRVLLYYRCCFFVLV